MNESIRFSTTLVERPEGTEAKWNKLFPLGTFYRHDFPNGSITFDKDYLGSMLANWERAGCNPLPVDYFHRGESDYSPVPNESKVASGWIEKLELRADGLWGLMKWTDKARAHILADELRYLSPWFYPNTMDPKTGKARGPTLRGAGLLNDPFLTSMPRVAASSSSTIPPANPPEASKAKGATVDKKMICAALGLAEDAADEVVMSKLLEKLSPKDGGPAKMSAAEVDERVKLATEPLKTALAGKTEEANKLSARVEKLEGERIEAAIEKLSEQLVREERIVPAQRDQVKAFALKMGVDEAAKFFKALPAKKTVGELGVNAGGDAADTPESANVKLRAAAEEIAKNEKVTLADARFRAMERNPALCNLAGQLKSPERVN